MAVTREQALWTANGFLRKNPIEGFTGITQVYSFDEIPFRKPCVYGVSEHALAHSWIAYCEGPDPPLGLVSSRIIIICKEKGKVLYAGSASDEG